ncbi:MAG: carboxypeptidase regulatory-like domain-containing protein [Edaphobacter sp.]|uniref:TonB-dependent receptor n=1 Tax=Edaphobacter sp. TaxID=1934404 RepID=UPI00239295E9|nr:carboxypeptidase regulatory-like domain-containing protein [Edaphobacter sp.]MDE1177459.1 carboxypeptidase regulatory-like domain-containing protein [Edaphobacter sp.]
MAQQGNTAGLFGSVYDGQGAALPGATITVIEIGTQQVRTDTTNNQGEYRIPSLTVGTYNIRISRVGFSPFEKSSVILHVNDNLKIEAKLGVDRVQTSVDVTSDPSLVQLQGNDMKVVVDSQRVEELPLNGRNLADLALLSPGVSIAQNTHGADQQGYGDGIKITAGSRQFSINGARNNETRYTLDGADNNDTMYNSGMPFPFPDASQEFSVVTAGKGVDVGSSPGGSVNIITKSGTNQYHGTLFWFVRNTAFNANNFFSTTGDQLKRNQGGFTIGGPIIKNKLFLFAGWQGTWVRQLEGSNLVQAMPAAYRRGDFSDLLNGSSKIQLVNPTTGTPYLNNQIPQSAWSPAMQKLLAFWPEPNANGLVSAPVLNNSTVFQYVGRADYLLNSHNTIYARYLMQSDNAPKPFIGNNLGTSQDGAKTNAHSGTLGWTWTITNNLLADSHVYLNYVPAHRNLDSPWGNIKQALGIDINPLANEMDVGLDGTSGFGLGSAGRSADFKRGSGGFSQSWQFSKGRHNVNFGGEMRWSRYNEYNPYHASGVFSFDGRCTGFDQADAILGCLGEFTQGTGEFEFRRHHYQALYGGDSIRLTPRLSIDLGLRWEPYTPLTDTKNRDVLFQQDLYATGVKSQVYSNSPAGLLYPGDTLNGQKLNNGITDSMWNLLAPRAGFALDVLGDGTMSLRGGAGIYYSTPEVYMLNALSDQAPFGYDQNMQGGSFDKPYEGRESLNVFPLPTGFLNNPNLVFPTPLFAYAQVKHWKIPSTYAWNLAIEHQVAPGWAYRLAYVGNHSSQLAFTQDINAPKYDYSMTVQGNAQTIQTRRPRPEFERLYLLQAGQNADYNGLQLFVSHPMRNGLNFTASYTFAKALDYTTQNGSVEDMNGGSSSPNPSNPFAFRGASDYDRKHVLVASVLYETPKLTREGTFASFFTNRWRIGSIATIQTGYPSTITASSTQAGCGPGCSPHADQTGPLKFSSSRSRSQMLNQYFNTANVTGGAPGSFGNIGRNTLYGPGYVNIDASINKVFALPAMMDSAKLEFRAEAFNVLNHANFTNPDTQYGNSTFGMITSTQGDPRILQFALKILY